MKVLIIGAAGMIGRKLAESIAAAGKFGESSVSALQLADVVQPSPPTTCDAIDQITCESVDITAQSSIESLLEAQPDIIVQLAAIVSGESEMVFEKGYLVNLAGMQNLLEAIRQKGQGYRPRLIFSSSIAVFGGNFPDVIGDDHIANPQGSYGVQKAVCELLVQDYSRKGYIDGLSVRLPTIIVRPGAANKAASSFYSGIIREPLNGEKAVLPVPRTVRHWFASPRAAIGCFHQAANLKAQQLQQLPAITLPGISATVQDLIDALERVAGPEASALIVDEADERIEKLVLGWPRAFDTKRAESLGFVADESIDSIVKIYIEDELNKS